MIPNEADKFPKKVMTRNTGSHIFLVKVLLITGWILAYALVPLVQMLFSL